MASDRTGTRSIAGDQHRGGVLVALHGHGDHASTALGWGRRVAPPDWDVIAPQAPTDGSGERSWFSSGPRGVNEGELSASMGQVEDIVRSVSGTAQRVVVAGFSQGGALALAMAWRGTGADRVIAMCSYFPEIDAVDEQRLPGERVPLLILSTDGDSEVPAFMGMDAAGMFRTAGFPVTSSTVAGTHRVDADLAGIAGVFAADGVRVGPWISLGIPVERVGRGSEFTSAEAVAEIAGAYERLGFHAGYVTDHPAPDDRWLAGGGHHALEPVAALAAAAVATRSLKLHTNVYVLPYRNPFLAAKALSSVDALSQGRLIAGVAAGYLRPEFSALGAEFDQRGTALEEALTVLPRIWAGRSVRIGGDGGDASSVTSLPATHGGPPLWVGGNSTTAMRRAVTMAQGWSPMPTPAGSGKGLKTPEISDVAALRTRLDKVGRLCDETGRIAPLTVCFVPFGLGPYLDDPDTGTTRLVTEIHELHELGVDWFPLMVPGVSRGEVLERAAALADALALG